MSTHRVERVRAEVVGEIAAARRESPWAAGQHLRLAERLTTDLPHTLAALSRGETSEWRAAIMVRETSLLSVEHRRQVDAELGGRIAGLGDKGLAGAAAAIGYRLDPEQAVKRNRKAEGDRRVSIRPAPDTMSYLTALLPVAQGVAVYAALLKNAAAPDRRR